ncbi:MAG: hypothetical protein U9N05_02080 [Euryarchaeota archaeon]|nr:hypothetical protein [Euryarchaeota archaeon]
MKREPTTQERFREISAFPQYQDDQPLELVQFHAHPLRPVPTASQCVLAVRTSRYAVEQFDKPGMGAE